MDDLKEIRQELKLISDTLIRNTASLEIHIARTNMAEKRLESLETFNRWLLGFVLSGIIGVFVKLFTH